MVTLDSNNSQNFLPYSFVAPKNIESKNTQIDISPLSMTHKDTSKTLNTTNKDLNNLHAKLNLDSINPDFYSPFGELIPNLTNIALQNINFSPTNAIGGITQVEGSGYTIAGIVSYMCGVPLNMPINGNSFNRAQFLEQATCVSDILDSLDYNQVLIQGSDAEFSGIKYFFNTHKVAVQDLNYYTDKGVELDDNNSWAWGLTDSITLQNAREWLDNVDKTKPFALYISTIDTHHPVGNTDKFKCSDLAPNYIGAIECGDRLISNFVESLGDLHKNTTIIILGDHLSHKLDFFPPNSKRGVYNAFIGAKFNDSAKLLSKNRLVSHFDIATLILDSIGIKALAFGLGRNPLYTDTLLESYGLDKFNTLIMQDSKLYENLWKAR